jgi:hypothetical protein
VLQEQLSGVKVYVVGDEAEKEVYIAGKTKAPVGRHVIRTFFVKSAP